MIFDKTIGKMLSKFNNNLENLVQTVLNIDEKLDIVLNYLVLLEDRLQESGINPINKRLH